VMVIQELSMPATLKLIFIAEISILGTGPRVMVLF
jgi:hypothetical protein